MTDLLDRNGIAIHTHGYGGYSRGCRCDDCRKAKADYMRNRRACARRRAHMFGGFDGFHFVPDIVHGRVGYEEHGCRCADCLAGRAESDRRYYRWVPPAVEGGDTP